MAAALERLRASTDAGHRAWSEADVAFHDAVVRASGNPLLQVCAEVVRAVAAEMIQSEIAAAGDGAGLMDRWVEVHTRMLELIRGRDAAEAAAQARRDLLEEYGVHLTQERRKLLLDWIGAD
jgi:GntR family transcriptional repressor for pyruvate dehydrogenase complex